MTAESIPQTPAAKAASVPAIDARRFLNRHRSVLIAFALLAFLFWLVDALSPGPLTYFDISYLTAGGATTALAAIGQTLVILTGGFDLSAGAVISLVNVVLASTMQDTAASQVAVGLLGIAIGGAVGAFNGFFIAVLRLQPIVVTLATLFIVQGLALLVRATPGGEIPGNFMALIAGDAIPGVLPAPLVILAIALGIWFYIKNTRLGTSIYAVGSDPDAARAAGVRERLVKFVVYVMAGCFYGAAGVFVSAQTGGSDPLVGTPMLLQIFAAVVLGGTILGGGRGGAVGSVIGAYLLMIFVNILLIADVPAYFSTMVEGLILILAVLLGSLGLDSSPVTNLRDVARRWSASIARRSSGQPRHAQIQQAFQPAATTAAPKLRWIDRNRQTLRTVLPVFLALAAMLIITALLNRGISGPYLNSLLVLTSFVGILALGQGTVVLSGGLDLSIPWTISLVAVLLTSFSSGSNEAAAWAVPVVLVLGALIGLANGIGITVLGLPPIVMTLAMNGILQGAALLYTQGTPAGFSPPALKWLATGWTWGVTPIVWLFALFVVAGTLLLGRTPLGRRIYSVGNNTRTAFLSGVNVRRAVSSAYVLSGFCSAVVGVLLVGFNGQASLGMGDDYLLPSIAVVVVGGTLITGGRGHYLGMVGGALLLTGLQTLLGGTTLPSATRSIIYGLVVLAAIVMLRERRTA